MNGDVWNPFTDLGDQTTILGIRITTTHIGQHLVIACLDRHFDDGHHTRQFSDGIQQLDLNGAIVPRHNRQPLGRRVVLTESAGAQVGAARLALGFEAPFVSGKDSLNNEYRVGDETIAIPPTLLISALAKVQDVGNATTMDFKEPGNSIYLVGQTEAELGGSVHFDLTHPEGAGGTVPAPELETAPRAMRALAGAISAGEVRACHDLSEGGLAVAAAESAFAGDLGAELDVSSVPLGELPEGYDADATRLFSESCTRWLVEVSPENEDAFRARFEQTPLTHIGRVTEAPRLIVRGTEHATLIDLSTDELRAAHQSGFQG